MGRRRRSSTSWTSSPYWYPQPHAQYAAWSAKEMPLDDAERAILGEARQAAAPGVPPGAHGRLDREALRRDRRPAESKQPARGAREKNAALSAAHAERERALLEHFAPRLHPVSASRSMRRSPSSSEARLAARSSVARRRSVARPRAAVLRDERDALDSAAVVVPICGAGAGRRAGQLRRDRARDRGSATATTRSRRSFTPLGPRECLHAAARGAIAVGRRKCEERGRRPD